MRKLRRGCRLGPYLCRNAPSLANGGELAGLHVFQVRHRIRPQPGPEHHEGNEKFPWVYTKLVEPLTPRQSAVVLDALPVLLQRVEQIKSVFTLLVATHGVYG
ncbi:hypothetical protein, conserved [Leishmania tarentolae]|uniref:Uncharacterized protein n=1 Tax=Leishmania tarentolae TaxID=5689 RepID=A0A640KP30_LEITA|nr:hypothetical protein, conserved [Leishmania tarentolae]